MPKNDILTVTSLFQAFLLALALIHVSFAPFSKVEESFNVHATHDIIFYLLLGKNNTKNQTGVAAFDHLTFPGVVPRSFTGAFFLSAVLYPVAWLLNFGLVSSYGIKVTCYYLIRCFLAISSWRGLVSIAKSLRNKLGSLHEKWFILLCCCQFHMLFYMGRLLPNSFALIISSFALKHWVDGNNFITILLLTLNTVVFRCDVIILLGLIGLSMLYHKQISFTRAICYGVLSVLISLLITVPIDSYFWNDSYYDNKKPFEDMLYFSFFGHKLVWPELQVFWFNVVLGKSVQWGELPYFWYFYSALPKSLLIALPLSVISPLFVNARNFSIRIDKNALNWLLVAFGFVIIYSVLKHKETRFLFPILPLFNILASISIARLEEMRVRNWFTNCCFLILSFGVVLSFILSSCFLYISSYNYPGGTAIFDLNRKLLFEGAQFYQGMENIKVHVGVYAAMTGATNYLMLNNDDLKHQGFSVSYSKDESKETLNRICSLDSEFNILLIEDVEYHNQQEECSSGGFEIVETFFGNPRIDMSRQGFRFEKKLYILQKTTKKNTGSLED